MVNDGFGSRTAMMIMAGRQRIDETIAVELACHI